VGYTNYFDGGSGLLTIGGDESVRGIGELELFDLSGRKLMTAKLRGNKPH